MDSQAILSSLIPMSAKRSTDTSRSLMESDFVLQPLPSVMVANNFSSFNDASLFQDEWVDPTTVKSNVKMEQISGSELSDYPQPNPCPGGTCINNPLLNKLSNELDAMLEHDMDSSSTSSLLPLLSSASSNKPIISSMGIFSPTAAIPLTEPPVLSSNGWPVL